MDPAELLFLVICHYFEHDKIYAVFQSTIHDTQLSPGFDITTSAFSMRKYLARLCT